MNDKKISRREALKRIGEIAMTVTITSVLPFGIVGKENGKDRLIAKCCDIGYDSDVYHNSYGSYQSYKSYYSYQNYDSYSSYYNYYNYCNRYYYFNYYNYFSYFV